jgi:2-keto-4-pentenoate hydratase/2-oxohepta-3-ene-1,7-dioic acid hydratase in catechol pathway
MKIARFVKDGKSTLGFVVDEEIIPFDALEGMPKWLEYPLEREENIRRLERKMDLSGIKGYPLKDVRLQSPLLYPGKIVCLGLNFKDHAKEQGKEPSNRLIIFMKPRTALTGPYDTVFVPKFVEKLDYEGELAIVIGRRGKNVPAEGAERYILGYTIMNDVSARDIQFGDRQWTRGKGLDGFAPIGPWIVTKDEIRDHRNLRIRTWLNEELRQDGNTSNMVFDVPKIIEELSRVMTLEPGDIISTGTPAGVGIFAKPEPKLIKDGDVVRIEIENIGFIENRFRFT